MREANELQLLRRIGGGSMTDVHLAQRHGAAGFTLTCAVKLLRPELHGDQAAEGQFLACARAGATLQHRNIAQVLDLGRLDGRYFVAMELVDGPSLAQLADSGALPSPTIAAHIVARAADGARYIHQLVDPIGGAPLQLAHGDIALDNVLLSRQGQVKLIAARATEAGGGLVAQSTDVQGLGAMLAALTLGSEPALAELADEAMRHRVGAPMSAARLAVALDRWLIEQGVNDPVAEVAAWLAAQLGEASAAKSSQGAPPTDAKEEARPKTRILDLADDPERARALFETSEIRLKARPLPRRSGRLFGGDAVLDRIAAHLGDEAAAVALRGVAGVGKTRVAAEFAHLHAQHGGAVWWVDLSDVDDLHDACAAIAAVLGVPLQQGSVADAAGQLGAAMQHVGAPLLVLDHVDLLAREAVALVGPMREAAPALHILLTTRRRIAGEGVAGVVVQPLPLPGDERQLARTEAVRFFVACARRADPKWSPKRRDLGLIAAIIRRLDGIPLALELAAARATERPLQALLRDLDRRFDTLQSGKRLGRGARSLRGALAMSWAQLPEDAATALAQLVIFRGGFTLEAAVAVVELGGGEAAEPARIEAALDALVGDSMLRRVADRFSLFESVRAFVYEQPADDATRQRALDRHCRYFIEAGEAHSALANTHDDAHASGWLSRERDNLAAVHRRVLRERGKTAAGVEDGLRVPLLLAPVLSVRGPMTTLHQLFAAAIQRLRGLPATEAQRLDPALVGRALARHAELVAMGGRATEAYDLAKEALALARKSGDMWVIGCAQYSLGVCYRLVGRTDEAIAATTRARSIARKHGDLALEAAALNITGSVLYDLSERHAAARCFSSALAAAKQVGHHELAGQLVSNLGCVHVEQGDTDRALTRFHDALATARRNGNVRLEGSLHTYMAVAAQERGDMGLSRMHFQRALQLHERVGFHHRKVYVQGLQAWHALESEGLAAAERAEQALLSILDEFVDKGDWRWRSTFAATLALLATCTGADERAQRLLAEAEQLASAQHDPAATGFLHVIQAGCLLHRCQQSGDQTLADEAERHLGAVRSERPGKTGGRIHPPLQEVCCEVRIAQRILRRFGLIG